MTSTEIELSGPAQDIELHVPQPAAISGLDYPALVAEGQRAAEVAGQANWYLGDIAREVETRYRAKSMMEFAEQIGVGYKHLLDCKRVAAAYPHHSDRSENSWTVCRILAATPELAVQHGKLTTAQARLVALDNAAGKRRKIIPGRAEPAGPAPKLPRAGSRAAMAAELEQVTTERDELEREKRQREGHETVFGKDFGGFPPPDSSAEAPVAAQDSPEPGSHAPASQERQEPAAACPACTAKDAQIAALQDDLAWAADERSALGIRNGKLRGEIEQTREHHQQAHPGCSGSPSSLDISADLDGPR